METDSSRIELTCNRNEKCFRCSFVVGRLIVVTKKTFDIRGERCIIPWTDGERIRRTGKCRESECLDTTHNGTLRFTHTVGKGLVANNGEHVDPPAQ